MSRRAPRHGHSLPRLIQWTPAGRALVFLLAATSIWCLLAEMYELCNMRTFALLILLPATVALYGLAVLDRLLGDRTLWRGVILGTLAGLVGAIVYDLFRLPFVFARDWGLEPFVPQMPLFKVFPRFGALILGEPLEQSSYSLAAHVLGWVYHFSNGATFGVMFAAMIGEAAHRWGGGWLWAVLMAVGIEVCLLASPYASFFNITLNARFITVTLLAHLVFGAGMGLYFAWHARLWPPAAPARA
jgi:hypothetical protein